MLTRKMAEGPLKEFNFTSIRIDLEMRDWKKINSIYCASPSGVFLVNQNQKSAFVIKATADIVSAYFTSKLYTKLQIPTTDVKIIAHYEKEFKFMVHEIDRLVA